VVEETIAGRGHQIKERIIGIEALRRGESFDPRLDPIVRTQAAKLRTRLVKYYESEGKNDLLLIEFRKGSYAPLFRRRCDTVSPVPCPQNNLVAPPIIAAPETAAQNERLHLRRKSVTAAVIVFALAPGR
jgi:hypothetical protein